MIGFYGGTFDPVHFGHLNLAIELMEAHRLSEVWFCPAEISPHRLNQKPISATHRLKMLELAIEDIPQFKLIDIESRRKGPSYTIDTLRDLTEQEKKKPSPQQIALLLGEDSLARFSQWRESEKIVEMVPLYIGSRSGDVKSWEGSFAIQKAIKKGLTRTKVMDISATEIRKRLARHLYCGHLLPAKVLDYIIENQLYL